VKVRVSPTPNLTLTLTSFFGKLTEARPQPYAAQFSFWLTDSSSADTTQVTEPQPLALTLTQTLTLTLTQTLTLTLTQTLTLTLTLTFTLPQPLSR